MSGPSRRLLMGAVAAALLAGSAAAQAADKVTLRTNWLFYGSHSIFLLGIDKGFYAKEGIDLTVKQANEGCTHTSMASPCSISRPRARP